MKGWGSLSINVIAFVNNVFHKHNKNYDASPLLYKYACKYWYPYQIYTQTQTLHIYVILLDLLHVKVHPNHTQCEKIVLNVIRLWQCVLKIYELS